MKIYDFSVGDDWSDWVVAENAESALECLKSFSDMGDEEFESERTCKELTEEQKALLKFYPDELGTGEPDESTAISFLEAVKGREAEMPFHLCSQIE